MKEDRPNTQVILIDLQYHDSMNAFECWYGDHISYQEIEQKSYIEFKELMFTRICRDIKFRKYGRIGQVLTIKADMLRKEIERFKAMMDDNEINLVHNWIISNITIIKDGELMAKQGIDEKDAEEEEDETVDEGYDFSEDI